MEEDNVKPITSGTEISDKGADELYVELQQVVNKYSSRITDAEAIGVLEMLKIRIYTDFRYEPLS